MKFKQLSFLYFISHFFLFAEAAQKDLGENLKNGSRSQSLTNNDNQYSAGPALGFSVRPMVLVPQR